MVLAGCVYEPRVPDVELVEVTPAMQALALDQYRPLVVASLRSPATARFVGEPQISAGAVDGRRMLLASGYVDSENGFGGYVRSRYRVTWRPDGSSWAHTDTEVRTPD